MLALRPAALLIVPLMLLLGPSGCGNCSEFNPFFSACPGQGTESETGTSDVTGPTTAVDPCGNGFCDANEDFDSCSQDCLCGNGVVDESRGEICDNGAANNSDEYQGAANVCNTSCTGYAPHCGDDVCQDEESAASCSDDCSTSCGNETCDAGEAMTCPKDCPVAPMCGNGVKEGDEVCDEGPTDTATCDSNCTPVVCNDSHLNMAAGEQCEDGNSIDDDACRNDCKTAACGDGVVYAAEEECDDGNDVDDDECSLSCEKPRFVFVTSSLYNGGKEEAGVAGVSGGDAKCQAAAEMQGLGDPANTWVAWLSDSRSSPTTRAAPENQTFGGWYFMRDSQGQRISVAKGWDGLIDGMLDNPINITEAGELAVNPNVVWTNTAIDGTQVGPDHCDNWTSSDDTVQGVFGRHVSSDQGWTRQPGVLPCAVAGHLYCIEMAPQL